MSKELNQWAIDPGHSTLLFKVRHLTIANVAGTFKIFAGQVHADREDFDGASITCEIDADSISTDHIQRDTHLRSEAFFDTVRFPKIIFVGRLDKVNENYELAGDLTIRDVTKRVRLEALYNGIGRDMFKNSKAGFEATGKINRKDFGMTFTMLTEAGGLTIGEDVKLHFDLELIKLSVIQAPAVVK